MEQINNFLNKYQDMKEFEEFISVLYKKLDIKGMFFCGSRANKTFNTKRNLSDFDFFVITSEKISKMQSLHYHIKDSRVEIMLYEEDKFCNPSSYDKNLLNKLLNKAELIFSKNDEVKKCFVKFSKSKFKKGVSESELDSMWFKIIWNVLKVKSYEKRDIDLAEIFAMQNYFFIGLLYGRLCGEPVYNLSESVKYMKKTNHSFWKKYKNILNKSNKRNEIEKIINFLPNSNYYLSKKSLIELDNFISPLTVIGDECKIIRSYRKEMNKLILPTLKFLDDSIIYYSIEGLGDVGKTTLLEKMPSAKFLKFYEISKNNKSVQKLKKMSKNNKVLNANDLFLKSELDRIKKFSKTKINILDRGIYSQIVYNYADFKTYRQKGIFHLIKELKKLEKNNFKYPKMVYLNCSVDYSINSLLNQKGKNPPNKTNRNDFVKHAKDCYDFLNRFLGERNSLEIKIPSDRKGLDKKLNKFIQETKDLPVDFTINKIEELLKG